MDSKQAKKNRLSGRVFELRVRKDLESKGWTVAKWTNNVEFQEISLAESTANKDAKQYDGLTPHKRVEDKESYIYGKLVAAKHKFRGPGIPMVLGTGFPDFIAIRHIDWFKGVEFLHDRMWLKSLELPDSIFEVKDLKVVIGVEAKTTGYLNKEEQAKAKWLLDNNIFSKILIASKGEKKGEIVYKEFNSSQVLKGKEKKKVTPDEVSPKKAGPLGRRAVNIWLTCAQNAYGIAKILQEEKDRRKKEIKNG